MPHRRERECRQEAERGHPAGQQLRPGQMRDHRHERRDQRRRHDHQPHAVEPVDHVIAQDADRRRRQRADHRADRQHHPGGQRMQRPRAKHGVRGKEPQVQCHRDHHHEQRAVSAELPTALDHLRQAEAWTLRRTGAEHRRADQPARHDRQHGPAQRKAISLHRHRARHHRQRRDIGGEPQRKQIAHMAVPFRRRNDRDAVGFHQ